MSDKWEKLSLSMLRERNKADSETAQPETAGSGKPASAPGVKLNFESKGENAENSALPNSPQALESEMRNLLSSLHNFKLVLEEFSGTIEKDCQASVSEMTRKFQDITRRIDGFHENLRLKVRASEKIESVKGIEAELAGAICEISQKAAHDEASLHFINRIKSLILSYSDIIEKVELLESNLSTFFRQQKSSSEIKQEAKEQSILPGSSAIIRSQEIERQRIAREIHDGPAQAIANIIFRLDIVQKVIDQNPKAIPDELAKVKEIAQGALNEIRHFIFDLRPMTLQDLGLIATLRKIILHSPGTDNTKVELMLEGDERELDPEIELAIFRMAQESLTNIRKHAKADKAWVQLKYFPDKVVLIVEDNGMGFDLKQNKQRNIDEYRSYGLIGMQERADDIGGVLQVTSQPMRGTKVIFTIPLNKDKK
jgi:two-component system sensor histidine kinase DegS